MLEEIVQWANKVSLYETGIKDEPFSMEDINSTDNFGNTMLMHACKKGKTKYVKYLLKIEDICLPKSLSINVYNIGGRIQLIDVN